MKKLALVTLLAVAASWLLSESPDAGGSKPNVSLAFHRARESAGGPIAPMPDDAPPPPEAIRTVPWRQAAGPAGPRRPSPGRTPPAPSWFPKSEIEEEARARPDFAGHRVLLGRLSASPDRAREDLRKTLEREIADWLAADVPPTWKPPAGEFARLVDTAFVQPVTRSFKPAAGDAIPQAAPPASPDVAGLDDLYTLYRAGQKVDFSNDRRARYVETYRRELATRRMQRLGGGLAMALACLAALTGYIRADEATRGYYSNRLRLVTLAGLGAAGAAAYRFLG